MNTNITHFFTGFILFTLLIPIVAATDISVSGITIQTAPNVAGVQWNAPAGIQVDHYTVYYAKQSILENNGKFLGSENTIGDQTSIALLDLKNRNFVDGDTLYIAISITDTDDNEHRTMTEEASATLIIPGTTHNSAVISLENAIAEGENSVRLVFSGPMSTPEGHPASHFTITDDDGAVVHVLSATADDNALLLMTTPMQIRKHYTITVGESVKAADGSAIDSTKREAEFVARPGVDEPDPEPEPTPDPVPAPAPISSSSSIATNQITETDTGSTTPTPTPNPTPTPTPQPQVDTTPPEDVTKLILRKELQSNGLYTVHASWKASLNSANDLNGYLLYESNNKGKTFRGPTALLATVISTSIANIPPGEFTMKISAIDKKDNESEGILESITLPDLPETGAATVLLSALVAGGYAGRRNRRSLRVRK